MKKEFFFEKRVFFQNHEGEHKATQFMFFLNDKNQIDEEIIYYDRYKFDEIYNTADKSINFIYYKITNKSLFKLHSKKMMNYIRQEFWHENTEINWQKISNQKVKELKKYMVYDSGFYGSKYFSDQENYKNNKTYLIRYSDHWGRFKSVNWRHLKYKRQRKIKKLECQNYVNFEYGFTKISDIKLKINVES